MIVLRRQLRCLEATVFRMVRGFEEVMKGTTDHGLI